jgi:hypothetical protein
MVIGNWLSEEGMLNGEKVSGSPLPHKSRL